MYLILVPFYLFCSHFELCFRFWPRIDWAWVLKLMIVEFELDILLNNYHQRFDPGYNMLSALWNLYAAQIILRLCCCCQRNHRSSVHHRLCLLLERFPWAPHRPHLDSERSNLDHPSQYFQQTSYSYPDWYTHTRSPQTFLFVFCHLRFIFSGRSWIPPHFLQIWQNDLCSIHSDVADLRIMSDCSISSSSQSKAIEESSARDGRPLLRCWFT